MVVASQWVHAQSVVTPAAPAARPAAVAAVSAGAAGDTVRVLLVADRETTLSSPVTATIKQLYVSIGKSFSEGQTLVAFECDEPAARLGMAKAELAGAVEAHEAKNSHAGPGAGQ